MTEERKGWKWSDVWASVANVQRPVALPSDDSEDDRGPRVPTDEEYADWVRYQPENARPDNVRMALHDADPKRWRRLRSDIRWVKTELRKMGLNPEDARWYL